MGSTLMGARIGAATRGPGRSDEATGVPAPRAPLDDLAAEACYCARCQRRVPVRRPWPHWKTVRNAWLGSTLALALVLPFVWGEFVCLMPSALGLASLGIGPLARLADERATCGRCRRRLAPGTDSTSAAGPYR